MKNNLKNIALIVGVIAVAAIIYWAYNNGETPTASQTTTSQVVAAGAGDIPADVQEAMIELADDDPFIGAEDAPVVIVEFSDFQCPFCARFRDDAYEALKTNFIDTGYVKLVFRDLPLSFHDKAQLAAEAAQCAHDQGKFWEYHDELFANQQSLDKNSLLKYAADLGLEASDFETCLDSGKYTEEVQKDAAAAGELGISGTPGFVINGDKLSGAQPYSAFRSKICQHIPEAEPCASIVKVPVIVINDERCTSCDSTGLTTRTSELFPGADYKYVDASTKEGMQLVKDNDLIYAPSVLFGEEIEETESWKASEELHSYFVPVDAGYMLRDEATGSSWFLSDEQREEVEAERNELLGLELEDNKPQVDFFVMSYCPYGNQAEELLKPVFDELKGEAIFNPRYVIYNRGTGCYTDDDGTELCSLHGEVELNQGMRELCVYNEYGEEAWFDFALAMNEDCNGQNADTCWEGVASGLGYDTEMITTCFDDNKVSYAREHYELNKMLQVSGSPTLFFEGERFNGARSSNAYLAAICAGFDDKPEACQNVVEETVSSATQAGAAAGCGI